MLIINNKNRKRLILNNNVFDYNADASYNLIHSIKTPAWYLGKKLSYTQGISDRSYQQNGDTPSSWNNTNTFKVESTDHNDYVAHVDSFKKNGKTYIFVESGKHKGMWFLLNPNIEIGGVFNRLERLLYQRLYHLECELEVA